METMQELSDNHPHEYQYALRHIDIGHRAAGGDRGWGLFAPGGTCPEHYPWSYLYPRTTAGLKNINPPGFFPGAYLPGTFCNPDAISPTGLKLSWLKKYSEKSGHLIQINHPKNKAIKMWSLNQI